MSKKSNAINNNKKQPKWRPYEKYCHTTYPLKCDAQTAVPIDTGATLHFLPAEQQQQPQQKQQRK